MKNAVAALRVAAMLSVPIVGPVVFAAMLAYGWSLP